MSARDRAQRWTMEALVESCELSETYTDDALALLVEHDAKHRPEVLREAEAKLRERAGGYSDLAEEKCRPSLEERAQEWHFAADVLSRMAAAEQGEKDTAPAATSTPQPAELVVYRASHDSIVMGNYTNREAARAHCEAYVRREFGTAGTLGWIPDHGGDDAPEELSVFGPETDEDGVPDEMCTGYVVTPLTVTSAYDEEADE